MNFSIYEQNLWTVKASDLLAANPQLHSMVLGELAGRGDEELLVGVSTASGVTRWSIYSDVPFRNGSTAIYYEGQMNLPATARPKVAWATVAVYAGAAVAVGYGLWWWSRRKRGGGMLMAPPALGAHGNKCCPPGAKQLSSGACQDRETKKFVKSVPCVRVLPAPRRVGVPEPFPKARDMERFRHAPDWRQRTGW